MAKTSSKPASRSSGSALGLEHADAFHPGLNRPDMADCILANGSTPSNQSGESEILKAIIEADLVHCLVTPTGHSLD